MDVTTTAIAAVEKCNTRDTTNHHQPNWMEYLQNNSMNKCSAREKEPVYVHVWWSFSIVKYIWEKKKTKTNRKRTEKRNRRGNKRRNYDVNDLLFFFFPYFNFFSHFNRPAVTCLRPVNYINEKMRCSWRNVWSPCRVMSCYFLHYKSYADERIYCFCMHNLCIAKIQQ